MTPQLHPEFLERIAAIDWFRRCGQPDELSIQIPFHFVDSWQEAEKLYLEPIWEEITQLGQNSITGYLAQNYKESYNEDWNRLAMEARAFVASTVTPKIRDFASANGLYLSIIGCVQWDILHSIMEDAYRDANLPVRLFAELLTVYEAGHFPCGWVGGGWDDGELAII